MPKLDQSEVISIVRGLIQDCETFNLARSDDRRRALDYYNGIMNDVPADDGRSSIVTREVRTTIKKVLPALRRTLLGNENIVEYKATNGSQEGAAFQATQYINKVTVPKARVREAAVDAFLSALLLKEGVLTWWNEKRRRIAVTYHSGLTKEEIAALKADKDAEILEQGEAQTAQMPDGSEIEVYSARVKRTITENVNKVMAVPIEDFGIHPDATSQDDALIQWHKFRIRRTDLVASGYDEDVVENLTAETTSEFDDPDHLQRDRVETFNGARYNSADKSTDLITIYRCFVRIDEDGDGISELREIHFVRTGDNQILFDDYADDARFAILVAERVPHTPRGVSMFEDIEDLQRLNTVLTRQMLDNLYGHNNPQPAYQDGAIKNPSAISSPQFGEPVKIAQGYSAAEALNWRQTPFVADKAAQMIDRTKQEIIERTGISSASAALDPEALQEVRQEAIHMISDQAAAQAWCMVQDIAAGMKRLFLGLLKLEIQFQDKPQTVFLNGQWVEFDPRVWDAELECEVNVGLGTGTRERDMAALQVVAQGQKQILEGFGPTQSMVTPENLYNTANEMTRAAGLQSPDKFFTKPQPGQPFVPPPQGPSPDQMKLQAQMQLEQAKMQAARDKEQAQMQADIAVKNAEAERDRQKAQLDAALHQQDSEQSLQIERERIASQERIEQMKLQNQLVIANLNAASTNPENPMLDPETGALKPSLVEQKLDAQGNMLAAIHQALTTPKRVDLVRGPDGRTQTAMVHHVLPESQTIN